MGPNALIRCKMTVDSKKKRIMNLPKMVFITAEELEVLLNHSNELIKERVDYLLQQLQVSNQSKEEYLSRKRTAELFDISFPCLNDWTKKGILKSYRLGARIYYKRSELDNTISLNERAAK